MIDLQITTNGEIRMLHDDAVDLRQFGKVEVSRASHVEFEQCGHLNEQGRWVVRSAKTGVFLNSFDTRAEALAWEKTYYSPSGKGWAELTEA